MTGWTGLIHVMPSSRVSIRQIAAACDLSAATVSRALHGSKDISASNRAMIQDLARRMGYEPNVYVSRLMSDFSRGGAPAPARETIGLLLDFDDNGWHHAPASHWARHIFASAEARAARLGYGLDPLPLGQPHMKRRRLVSLLEDRSRHGLIRAPIQHNRIPLSLPWPPYHTRLLRTTFPDLPLARVRRLVFQSLRTHLTQLAGRGYRRFGCCLYGLQERRHF